jgi:hypothetical protein
VFVQNGIPWWYAQGLDRTRRGRRTLSRSIRAACSRARCAGARDRRGGVFLQRSGRAGSVTNHSAGRNMLVIGETDDRQSPRIAALRALLERRGHAFARRADIRQAVWDKLLINFGSTLCVGRSGADRGAGGGLRACMRPRERCSPRARHRARCARCAAEDAPRRPGGASMWARRSTSLDAAGLRARPADGGRGDPGDALRFARAPASGAGARSLLLR